MRTSWPKLFQRLTWTVSATSCWEGQRLIEADAHEGSHYRPSSKQQWSETSLLERRRSCRSLPTIADHCWLSLAIDGHCCPLLTLGDQLSVIADHCWLLLTISGHFWPLLTIVGHCWPFLTIDDPTRHLQYDRTTSTPLWRFANKTVNPTCDNNFTRNTATSKHGRLLVHLRTIVWDYA